MFQTTTRALLLTALLLAACGDDSGAEGSNNTSNNATPDKGGPDSLIGATWKGDPITANGITFEPSFTFNADSVIVSNTCDGAVTASATAPVRYHYDATTLKEASKEVEGGGDTCSASVQKGSFSFEIIEGKLRMTYMDQTIEFSPVGGVAGLYGTWGAPAPGVGTLEWTMGGGKIGVTSKCDNGLTASTSTSATFINYLTIKEAAMDEVEDGGITCNAGINAGTFTYRFDGADIILTQNGQDSRFKR
jgi:hypothetical protein